MTKRILFFAYWAVALPLIPFISYAYIDPATTTYIIQIITAIVITLGVTIGVLLYRVRMITMKTKAHLLKFRVRASAAAEPPRERAATGAAGETLEYFLPVRESFPAVVRDDEYVARAPLAGGGGAAATRSPGKWKRLVRDDRRFGKRVLTILPLAFALSFSFIVFSCFDLYSTNYGDMPFTLKEITPVILEMGAIAFVLSAAVMMVFKGRLLDIVMCVALSALLGGYLQSTFMNKGLGELTGDALDWSKLTGQTMINAGVWALVFIVVMASRYFLKKEVWRKGVILVPLVVVAVQFVALMSVLPGADTGANPAIKNSETKALTYEGIYNVGSGKNVAVFLLDRLDERFVDMVSASDPDFFAPLDGFTQYTNNLSTYSRTFPGMVELFTGKTYFWERPAEEYFDEAYGESSFFRDIKQHDFLLNLYLLRAYDYSNVEQLADVAENNGSVEYSVRTRVAMVKLLKLSALRNAPHMAKPTLWMSTAEMGATVMRSRDEYGEYIDDDVAFYDGLRKQRLSVVPGNNFSFYHLNGPHAPFTMSADVKRVDKSNVTEQTKGSFQIVYEYIDQLKKLGLYENTTIIITGDHGDPNGGLPIVTGLLVKPAGASGTPLKTSNAPTGTDNFRATVIDAVGGDTSSYGLPYDKVPEDADRVWPYYLKGSKQELVEYEVTGDAKQKDNWRKIGTIPFHVRYIEPHMR
ncbi:MAG: sulfatase-like hydrolase/transferase [Clostridiales Family XIII bacterium]|jgi:hypothetical protein|nr:sulfatase-like hydrolase/transferase [Clostridiales Family XIII bacterium]